MDVRRYPISAYLEYVLDGAVEGGELDVTSSLTLRLYGDAEHCDAVVAAPRAGSAGRRRMCLDLADLADASLPHLAPERRATLLYTGALNMIHNVRDLTRVFACWAIGDMVEGGYLEDHRHGHRADCQPTRRIARRLRSRSFARRFVQSRDETTQLRELWRRQIMRCTDFGDDRWRLFMDTAPSETESIRADLSDQRARQRAMPSEQINTSPAEIKTQSRRDRRRQRRSIVRATRIAAGLLGAHAVGAYARGEAVTVRGRDVDLVVKRQRSLSSLGHGANEIEVAARDGTRLAELCVYMENTPAVDQLAGLSLHMLSGLESEVLAAANVVTCTPAGLAHPLFENRKATADHRATSGFFSDYEVRQRRDERYWTETRAMWLDASAVAVFGRHSRHAREWMER